MAVRHHIFLLVIQSCLISAEQIDCIGSPTDNVAFDSSNYVFIHPYNTSPSTGVGNMTLFIGQQYITDNLGNVSTLHVALKFMSSDGNGILLVDGLVELGMGYSLDNDAVLEIGREGRQWRPNSGSFVITNADYSICSSGNTSYWSIPVVFLLTKGPRTVGTRRWVIDVSSIADNENVSSKVDTFNFTTPTINVITEPFEGCGPDQRYIFSTNSCVSTCPCSTKPFPKFCLEGKQGFLNQTVITTVNISSDSKNETIHTYYLLIDPNLYYPNEQTKNTIVHITVQHVGVKMEGTDLLMRSHDVQPVFELFVPGAGSAVTYRGSSLTIEKLRDIVFLMLENCSYSNGSYDILPIQVRLVSPSLYQLGEHVIIVSGELMPTETQSISIYGQLQLVVRTNTPCTNASRKLLDLDRQECVSECTCGDLAFRNTLTPYCEPVHIHRPVWLGDTQLKMEVIVGNSTTSTVRVYFRPMIDNLVMHLRIEKPQGNNSKPQLKLQIGDELQESLNVSLNTSYLGNQHLENCSSRIGEELSYFLLTIVVDNVLVPGEFQFIIVAEFSSNNSAIEDDLRHSNRDIDVTQRLIVDLTGVLPSTSALTISPTSTTTTTITTSSTTISSAIPRPTGPMVPLTDQVVVTLTDLTNMNFSEERQKAFKGAVAQAINEYCAQVTPGQCMQRRRRKRQSTVSVQSGDVVITDIMESGSNLLVWLYVQRIAPVQAVISAIEANTTIFFNAQFSVINVSLAATPMSTATNMFTPTATPTASPTATATSDLRIIVGVCVAAIIFLAFITVVLGIVYCFLCYRKRKHPGKTTDHKLDASDSTDKLNVTEESPLEETKPADATNDSNKQDIELSMKEVKPADASNNQDVPDGKEDVTTT